MIQSQSKIRVSDNSGARKIMCLRIIPGTKKIATSGNSIIAVIKKALPSGISEEESSHKKNSLKSKIILKKSDIILAAIIRVKTFLYRDTGFLVAFDKNAAVIIKPDKTPRATRIFGPVSKEVRKYNLTKIISLGIEIV